MTLEELSILIDNHKNGPMWRRNKDCEVVILLDMPSMGPRSTTKIVSGGIGVDWEKNMFIFKSAEPIVTK